MKINPKRKEKFLRIIERCIQKGVPGMPMDPERKEFWQTIARSTIKERFNAIFNQELLSDVKFAVCGEGGSGSKTIPAHKFVLAISSPVFFTMFYGEMAEGDCVEIPDCEYESLLEVLRFIYSDAANLNPGNVMQVLYLAKKYMLPSLAEKCSVYLQGNIDASSVFLVLPLAQKYEEIDLLDCCWQHIEDETEEAVKSDGFVAIERSVLEELVERDSLNVKEVELFKAVDSWAKIECEKQGLKVEGSVKRRILGERIVKGIRFPVMEEKEFASVVLDSGILSHKETNELVKYFNSVPNTSREFSQESRKGSLVRRVYRFSSFLEGWEESSKFCDVIGLSCDKDINLCAVRLFGNKGKEYRLHLEIQSDGSDLIRSKDAHYLPRQIKSEMGSYPGFDVMFKPPIALKANSKYWLIADICGPPSWYGKGGQSRMHCSGVTFKFCNLDGMAQRVKKGQFPELLFTLA